MFWLFLLRSSFRAPKQNKVRKKDHFHFKMTKRPRPWGDNDDSSRVRKTHLSQKDMDKKSDISMAGIYTKTLGLLFKGSKQKAESKCESCVVSNNLTTSNCISCRRLTCKNCQDVCDNCLAPVCSQCSIQSPSNHYKRRCLSC